MMLSPDSKELILLRRKLSDVIEVVQFVRSGIVALEELECTNNTDTLHAMRLRTEIRTQRNKLQQEKSRLQRLEMKKSIPAPDKKNIAQLIKFIDSTQKLYRKKFSALPSPTLTSPVKALPNGERDDELATVCSESSLLRRGTLMGASAVSSPTLYTLDGTPTPSRRVSVAADNTDFTNFAETVLVGEPPTSPEIASPRPQTPQTCLSRKASSLMLYVKATELAKIRTMPKLSAGGVGAAGDAGGVANASQDGDEEDNGGAHLMHSQQHQSVSTTNEVAIDVGLGLDNTTMLGTELETATQQHARRTRWSALLQVRPDQKKRNQPSTSMILCIVIGVAVVSVIGATVAVVFVVTQ